MSRTQVKTAKDASDPGRVGMKTDSRAVGGCSTWSAATGEAERV